jgi:GTP-binding protein
MKGFISGDETIAKEVRQTGPPLVLAVNKTDDKRGQAGVSDFISWACSVLDHAGTASDNGKLWRIGLRLSALGFRPDPPSLGDDPEIPRGRLEREPQPSADDLEPSIAERQAPLSATIAIVGRPNVGKSSLLNRLLNEERVMVSDMPGTTRDAIDATLTWHRRRFRIVDTAGMRGYRIILPGVGAFGDGIRQLRAGGMIEALETARRKARPIKMPRLAGRPTERVEAW